MSRLNKKYQYPPVGEGLLQAEMRSKAQRHGTSASQAPSTPTEPEEDSCKSFCHQYIYESIWPGLGLFGESYVLFSIGTLKPMWEVLYPDCFNGQECSPALLSSLTYSVVLGVMVGMLALGYAANHLGRRKGSIITASIMAFGAWGLTLSALFLANHVVWLYRSLSLLFFIFGLGVGGEYPLSASSASERAMGDLRRRTALEQIMEEHQQSGDGTYAAFNELYDTHPQPQIKASNNQRFRGRRIQLVFSMQGMGILCNSITMMALLAITGQAEILDDDQEPEYTNSLLLTVWRITYALGAVMLSYVLISRLQYLEESKVWTEDKQHREHVRQSRPTLLQAVVNTKQEEERQMQQQQPPFVATISNVSSLSVPSITVDFHNQSIHTTGFAASPTSNQHPNYHLGRPTLQHAPSTDPEDDLKASPSWLFMQNYGLRLIGSSLSWLLWDIAFYGNKLFQSTFLLALTGESTTLFEFSMATSANAAVALLGYFGAALLVDKIGRRNLQQYGFLITGSLFVSCGFLYEQLSPTVLVCLYLASSFCGQLGPNATTFLIPTELFPTEMRSFAHGICAAAGKAGALIAAVLFNYSESELDLFLFCGYASFVACLITFCTIPETLGLDLYEVDKKWRMILEGRKGEYRGDANHPMYLSYYERSKLYRNVTTSHVEVE